MSERIWNGSLLGLPRALLLALGIATQRLLHVVNTLLWRGNLQSMGAAVQIQWGVTIRGPGRVSVGNATSIASGAQITSEFLTAHCDIGSNVIIGSNVKIDYSGGIEIADGVVISENTVVFSHSHGLNPKSEPRGTPLVIEKDVWIGSNVIVIEGVSRIGRGAVVAAGAVVTRPVEANAVVAGIPARHIKTRTDVEI